MFHDLEIFSTQFAWDGELKGVRGMLKKRKKVFQFFLSGRHDILVN